MPSTDVAPTTQPADVPTGRYNRVGGDVEVRVDRDPSGAVRVRGTWRRLWLLAAWTLPLLLIEAGLLYAVWVALPVAGPVVLAVAAAALAVHGWRGLRHVLRVVRPLLLVDGTGIRGAALDRAVPWDEVEEIRRTDAARGPQVSYLTRDGGSPTLSPADLPTELLLDLLVPADVPVALGHPSDDPVELTVEDGRLGVRPARGRVLQADLDDVLALDVAGEPVGNGRVARRLELLAAVEAPVPGGRAEELVVVPETVARDRGLVDALARFEPALPQRLAAAGAGRTELWSRAG
ncbi:hypothetical protein [Egicoccus sp. AB-alg2]|uniref:hypothetical protein n=1 Tax=Egicoccus sp. AB-alg2 TaxID=3242693 RepID=UPI00359E8256